MPGLRAIQARELPHQPYRCGEYEQHINHRTRADRGHDRHALRRHRHQPACLLIQRGHQFAFGEPYQIGAIDDVGAMAPQRGPRPRKVRVVVGEFHQIAHDRICSRAIVGRDCGQRASMQILDGRKTGKARDFARRDDD